MMACYSVVTVIVVAALSVYIADTALLLPSLSQCLIKSNAVTTQLSLLLSQCCHYPVRHTSDNCHRCDSENNSVIVVPCKLVFIIGHHPEQLRAHFVSCFRCWSYIGRIYWRKGGQTLSLGYRCNNRGIIMHEMMHAIGFWHEQSRPDRDQYVEVLWDNISKGTWHFYFRIHWQ